MAENIEILTFKYNTLKFTVNNAVDYVNVTVGASDLLSTTGANIFKAGDNFIILSCGLILPENFSLSGIVANFSPFINLQVSTSLDVLVGNVLEFGTSGQFSPIVANYEYALGQFVNINNYLTTDFKLKFSMACSISMVGINAAYNGKGISIFPFIKISHNSPLTF